MTSSTQASAPTELPSLLFDLGEGVSGPQLIVAISDSDRAALGAAFAAVAEHVDGDDGILLEGESRKLLLAAGPDGYVPGDGDRPRSLQVTAPAARRIAALLLESDERELRLPFLSLEILP